MMKNCCGSAFSEPCSLRSLDTTPVILCYFLFSWSSSRSFISLISLSAVLVGTSIVIRVFSDYSNRLNDDYCSDTYANNLGHRSYSSHLCYPVIDAVYTWVNGSDPVWLKEMLSYQRQLEDRNGLNSTNKDGFALNRFRENDELKYMLLCCSLLDIRFAPLRSLLLGFIRCSSWQMVKCLPGWTPTILKWKSSRILRYSKTSPIFLRSLQQPSN